jgi:hypothetical protein
MKISVHRVSSRVLVIILLLSVFLSIRTAEVTAGNLEIDVYTQYPAPYGGQGGNQTSDGFGPQQEVDLFALVTYNEYPESQQLVGFQIFHNGLTQTFQIYRQATTNDDGIANTSFNVPWPHPDPVNEIFGWWYVNATVRIGEILAVDNLKFFVWWPVQAISVEPEKTDFIQRKAGGDALMFTVVYASYSMQMRQPTIAVTAYDELGFYAGSSYLITAVGWGVYGQEGQLRSFTAEVTFLLPTNAVVGRAEVFGNAYDNLPSLGGTALGPEAANTIAFFVRGS